MASWLLPVLLTSGITLLTAALGVIWVEIKAGEARTGKRLDEIRADMKELRSEYKADNRALNEKLDRLVASLLTARQNSCGPLGNHPTPTMPPK